MSYYVHDGGWQDFPTRREAEEDARWDDFVSDQEADEDSFSERYGDEIDGRVRNVTVSGIAQAFDIPEPVAEQLALFSGAAYR